MKTYTFFAAHMNKVGAISCNDLPKEHANGNKGIRTFTCVHTDRDAAYKQLVTTARNSMRFTWVNHLSFFKEG